MQQFSKVTDQINKEHDTPGSSFQCELEHFDAYQSLMHKLRPNILELEMYCDLIKKCFTFGEIMMKWLDNEAEDITTVNKVISCPLRHTPLRRTDIFSEPMIWKIVNIDIVLERIIQMMISHISKMTGVERQLVQQDISVELIGLAKIFLWLVLQDQKRYEMLFPTGKEIGVNDDIQAVSYIDQHSAEWKYSTNIVRCTITKEVEEYLSSRITNGIGPEISQKDILSKSSCNPSLAKIYAKSLNKILRFLKEANVKIQTHIMDPKCIPSAKVSNKFLKDDDNRAVAIPGAVFDETDPEPEPKVSLYSFRNIEPRIPGPGFHFSDSDSDSWVSSESIEAPVSSIERIQKENKALLWDFIQTLVSRILRKAEVYKADVNFEAIVMGLFEITWHEVKDVEFIPTSEPFHELDKIICHKLCRKWGSVVLVVESIKLLEPAIGKCIASSVKNHLLTHPRKRNTTCRFFSSVGHCLLKVVDAAFPGSIFYEPDREPLTPIHPFEIYTYEVKKELIRKLIDKLITRILRKAKVYKADVYFETIVKGLFDITWPEVKDIEFSATPEEFDKLPKVIFNELCNTWSSVRLVLEYIQLMDPVIGKCIASSVKHHLLPPPMNKRKSPACCLQ